MRPAAWTAGAACVVRLSACVGGETKYVIRTTVEHVGSGSRTATPVPGALVRVGEVSGEFGTTNQDGQVSLTVWLPAGGGTERVRSERMVTLEVKKDGFELVSFPLAAAFGRVRTSCVTTDPCLGEGNCRSVRVVLKEEGDGGQRPP
jgi:hypothetical protein